MKLQSPSYSRASLASVIALALMPVTALAASFEMATTGGCECCHAWARHLEAAGHDVKVKELAMGQLMKMKLDSGIPASLTACHTAKVDGYLIEGHVPAQDIEKLLGNRPDALGLIVAGMPIGSPGMESGNKRDAFDVLLLKKDGSTEVFSHYAASSK